MSQFLKPKFPPVAKKVSLPETKAQREIRIANEAIRRANKAQPREFLVIEVKTNQGSKPKAVETKIDNNGWGKTFTADQLARVTIDSDISIRSKNKKGLSAKEARSKSKKG